MWVNEASSTGVNTLKTMGRWSEAGRPERRELQQTRRDRMSEVISSTAAYVGRYFRTELIRYSWQQTIGWFD